MGNAYRRGEEDESSEDRNRAAVRVGVRAGLGLLSGVLEVGGLKRSVILW